MQTKAESIARLEGFLKAFEWINHKINHQCRYLVFEMPKADPLDALATRFHSHQSDFQLKALPDIETELRAVLAHFMFLFFEDTQKLANSSLLISLMDETVQGALLDEMATLFRSLKIRAAWRVKPSDNCEELREYCFQDDVLLELPDHLCLLHFGVTD